MSIVSIISTSISITLKIMAKDKLAHGVRSPVTLSSPPYGVIPFWLACFLPSRESLCGDAAFWRKKVKEKL